MSIYERFSPQELDILRARAERVARSIETDEQVEAMPVLLTAVRNEIYALPVEHVLSIYEDIPVIPVPCTPPFLAGIANIRGRILPVIDLGTLLDVPGDPGTANTALVVASDGDLEAAFRVEGITETQALATSSILSLPPNLETLRVRYLRGVLPDGAALLDLAAILSDPALSGTGS